jgi:hypothetical protein
LCQHMESLWGDQLIGNRYAVPETLSMLQIEGRTLDLLWMAFDRSSIMIIIQHQEKEKEIQPTRFRHLNAVV